jgi:hypothetical protein
MFFNIREIRQKWELDFSYGKWQSRMAEPYGIAIIFNNSTVDAFHEYETWKILHSFLVVQNLLLLMAV